MCSMSVSKRQRNSVLYANRIVYIAYEVRISCKGHLVPLCEFIVTLKTNFMFQLAARGCLHSDVRIEYIPAPMSLTKSVFM